MIVDFFVDFRAILLAPTDFLTLVWPRNERALRRFPSPIGVHLVILGIFPVPINFISNSTVLTRKQAWLSLARFWPPIAFHMYLLLKKTNVTCTTNHIDTFIVSKYLETKFSLRRFKSPIIGHTSFLIHSEQRKISTSFAPKTWSWQHCFCWAWLWARHLLETRVHVTRSWPLWRNKCQS